jgi:hypothetical protein
MTYTIKHRGHYIHCIHHNNGEKPELVEWQCPGNPGTVYRARSVHAAKVAITKHWDKDHRRVTA